MFITYIGCKLQTMQQWMIAMMKMGSNDARRALGEFFLCIP